MSMEDEERLGTEKNRQIRKEKVLGSSGERRDPPKKNLFLIQGARKKEDAQERKGAQVRS